MKKINDTKIMSSFLDNSELMISKPFNSLTRKIILSLYDEIKEGYKFLLGLKKRNQPFYHLDVKKINSTNEIPRPISFSKGSFPEGIIAYINDNSNYVISYTFSLFERNIRVFFILENKNGIDIEEFNRRIEMIMIWLFIANKHATKKCAEDITVFFYFTSLKKSIVNNADNSNILYEKNVNTGFTMTCPKKSEIVIYRKEEFLKVFIHEIFHNFALDFSDMHTKNVHDKVKRLFKLKTRVNLFEAYTEFWAEFINALFCSFFSIRNKNDEDAFLEEANYLINLEVSHSFFQMAKVLNRMGLTYQDLYANNKESEERRNLYYIEKTHILSYYIIKAILMNSYQDFLKWCNDNNKNLLEFNKTDKTQISFFHFIESHYDNKSMLRGVKLATELLDFMHNQKSSRTNKTNHILNNLRMSLCELAYS